MSDEAVHSEAYREDIPTVLAALDDLEGAFGDSLVDKTLLEDALGKMEARFTEETQKYDRNVCRSLPHRISHTLSHNTAAGVGSRCRLQTNHTRSSPTTPGV